MSGRGGRLGRTETVSVRLDPRLNCLAELAARAQRRTKSSFIEWAIQEALHSFDPHAELARQEKEMRGIAERLLGIGKSEVSTDPVLRPLSGDWGEE